MCKAMVQVFKARRDYTFRAIFYIKAEQDVRQVWRWSIQRVQQQLQHQRRALVVRAVTAGGCFLSVVVAVCGIERAVAEETLLEDRSKPGPQPQVQRRFACRRNRVNI